MKLQPSSNCSTKTDYKDDPLFGLIGDGHIGIPYRPFLRQLVGDVNAAILLQQIAFRYVSHDRKPFYKFVEPCEHPLYRPGDSWAEELAFSKDQLLHALKKIATRTQKSERKAVLKVSQPEFGLSPDKRNKDRVILINRNALVTYWRERDNVLRFELNEHLLINAVEAWNKRLKQDNPTSEVDFSYPLDSENPPTYNIKDSRNNNQKAKKTIPETTSLFRGLACGAEIDILIADLWETTAPATIAKIRTTLLGEHPETSKHHLANVTPPATLDEIRAMHTLLHKHMKNATMPRDPVKIQDWLYQVRSLTDATLNHRGHLIEIAVQIPESYKQAPKQNVLAYLEKTHPEEWNRLLELMKLIDTEYGAGRRRLSGGYFQVGQERVEFRAEFPSKIWNGDIEAFHKYFGTFWPREYARVVAELNRIRQEQQAPVGVA